EAVQILQQGPCDVTDLPAAVLTELPEADADLVAAVRVALERVPLLELLDEPVGGAQREPGLRGDLGEAARGQALLEDGEDGEHPAGDRLPGLRHAACHRCSFRR